MLHNFSEIKVENPSDKIIGQIRTLITSGQLNPGDKLPPERKLAEKFGVGRSHVRDAIRKLEFYGILKTLPQSGTLIAGIGIHALEGLISDVLDLEEADFKSLVETRVLLEVNGAALAAERRSVEDIMAIQSALDQYERQVTAGKSAVEEDLLFHLKIAEAAQNRVLKSLMLIITPDIIKNYVTLKICTEDRNIKTIKEHREILQCIIDQDGAKAQQAMQHHLKDVSEYSRNNYQ